MGFAGLRDLPPPPLPDPAPQAMPAGGPAPGQATPAAAVQQVNRNARRFAPKYVVAGVVIAIFGVAVVLTRLTGDDGISETQPPVGRGLTLERPQIRWCVAEDIRLEAGRRALHGDRKGDVQRFNEMVQDFNARCASYRYRSGMLQSVRGEVEARRSQLEADGAARFQ
jgi:hypothetical protein